MDGILSLAADNLISPIILAFALLRLMTRLPVTDAAAVAAHYGSISIVTFVAATSVLTSRGLQAEGYMVAVAEAMEAPAILAALWLVAGAGGSREADGALIREILLNGSGRSGQWSREGRVGRSGMAAVICIIRPERLDELLEAAFTVVDRHIGVVSVIDCELLRAERF
jgi:hypothetical protein